AGEARRKQIEDQLGRLEIRSPISGVIATPRIEERVGSLLRKGDLLALVQDVEGLRIEMPVPEKEVSDVSVGQDVQFRTRASPTRLFTARVVSIAPTVSVDDRGTRTVLVSARIEDPDADLKPGMTGTARIVCGRARLVDLLTRRLARSLRVEVWSWW